MEKNIIYTVHIKKGKVGKWECVGVSFGEEDGVGDGGRLG